VNSFVRLVAAHCILATLVVPLRADESHKAAFDCNAAVQAANNHRFQHFDHNPVLAPGAAGHWDAGAIGSVSVIQVGSELHMYYEAWAAPADGGGLDFSSLQIGHAVSNDGIHWVKDPANPVIARGQLGAWDANGTWDPFVIHEDGIFKVWYGGGIERHCDYGYAESHDGSVFEKRGRISQIGQLSDGHVVHRSKADPYLLYYFDKRFEPHNALFCARSNDAMSFDFARAAPIHIVGESPDTMFKFSHVVAEGDVWYMFYANFVRPHAADSTTRLATSPDGIHWTRINDDLFPGHDAEIVSINDSLHLAYFNRRGYYNQLECDVRLAIYSGRIQDLVQESPPAPSGASRAEQ
jgi:hypothetical protein